MVATKKNKTQPPATIQNFPIVGIGASAGGLDAFKKLLKAVPEKSGMAYVLVQHLDPSHESILPEILQKVTKIPVHEITEDIHLAPDHIYIIPSNKILTSTNGILQLSLRDKKILNLSIDIFFTSLAEVHKEFAVGVILSGTGNDGTQGLKAVKKYGGISIAQSMDTAIYDSMPKSAINAGVVDFILAPEKIPEQLLQIKKTSKTNKVHKNEKHQNQDEENIFKQILLLLHQRSGVDFTNYKDLTLHRRIARRIAIVKEKNFASYLDLLRSDKTEQDALFQDMLIPVTSFFRDRKTFQTLSETIFPLILKNKNTNEPIRIWVAGCSTGEEVYSIAISLQEFLGSKLRDTKIQIFASDISEKAIKKARTGIYTKTDLETLSESQLENYFTKNNTDYEITKVIRDMCIFAQHNFLKDPPFTKMDLITCRNVLIYMDVFLQQKAFTTFHYSLKENGFLLLGKSETIGTSSSLFTQLDKHEKIYSRKPILGRFRQVATERKEEALITKNKTVAKQKTVHNDFRKSAEEIMIAKSPASVVVNEQMDLVHIHGDITPFLQAPQGKPTHNLIKMAREGLAFELRNTIHKVMKEQVAVTKENISIKTNGKQFLITIETIPITDTIEPHYLVRFEKKIPVLQEENKYLSGNIVEIQKQNVQLEKELSEIREDMRFITEDMESANEELQSTNEELQSSNEEMQSLNEELETSKEELQSTNEELTIVNQELLDKQEQLNASRYFAESIVATIREPLLVLDTALRIKIANASFYKKFNAKAQDTEGKLFYEIQNHQWDDSLMRSLLEKILPNRELLTDFKIVLKFPVIGKRTLLLNAQQIINKKNNEPLFLLAIEDITDQSTAQKIIEKSVALAETAKYLANEAKTKAETDKEKAENAVLAKQQFLSNMSHEIRTPMNAIIGFTRVMLKTDLTEKQKEYLDAIKSSGNTLIFLINDILDLAKVDAGKMIFMNSPFKISQSITTILHLFDTKIQESNLELVKEYDSRIPEIVMGDSVRLHQILINLIGNAIKFTPNGKITLSVNLLHEDKDKVTIEIKVIDTGIGIPEDKIAIIFENFEQAHTMSSSLYGGTGLGLAIVKQLVEKQGGTISIKSKVNEGSTFSFILSFEKTLTEIPLENEEIELDNEIKDIKVLVVEDFKLNQLLMRIILDNFKFKHDIANNGKIAIEKLQTNSYDIILMDLQMPIMNGFETTKYIRNEMNLQIPIIALTADVITVDLEKCKSIGMNDYITKPLDERLLYSKIVNLLKTNQSKAKINNN